MNLLTYFIKMPSIQANDTKLSSRYNFSLLKTTRTDKKYNFSCLRITQTSKKLLLRTSNILLLVSFLITSISYSQSIKENTHLVDSLMKHYEKNNRIFGSLTISYQDEVILNEQYGYENLKKKKKASAKTKYRIGSISKMYTSVMVLQLIEEEKLSLQTSLYDYYPNVKYAKDITIKNLLNHSSGIFNFTNDTAYLNYHTNKQSKKELLERIYAFTPSFKPNKKNSYSNSNYILLSFIIEDVTGKSYTKNLKERIVKPLKLKDTYYGNKTKSCQHEAFSYQYMGEWEKSLETNMSVPIGAGAVVATTKDLSIFIDALFNYKLISKPHVDSMMTLTNNYGLGMFAIPFYKRTSYGHTGGIDGFSSITGHFIDDDLTIAWSSNGSRVNNIMLGILKLLYNKEFEFPEYKEVKLDKNLLEAYSGKYVTKSLPIDINIRTENDMLFAQATGQPEFILEAVNDSTFKFEPAKVELEFNKVATANYYQLTLKQGGQEFIFKHEAQ